MSDNKSVDLKLSTEEINLVLEGLGQMPYMKVYQLIDKITSTSYQQLNATEAASSATENPA